MNKMQEKNNSKFINIFSKLIIGNAGSTFLMFSVIFILNLFLFLEFKSYIFLFIDTSREVYIPMTMNNEYILYKDILNVYAPLGYQLNALLTKIFGLNFNTFFIAGFINSTLILWGIFLILKLFIRKNSNFIIFSVIILISSSCLYAISHCNYIFPYSYSMVYALNTFIWSLVALLYFLKYKNNKFLYLSFFMYGLSISFKYEFMPFFFILTTVVIIKKIQLKTCFYILLLMIISPVISLLILLIQGVTVAELYTAVKEIFALSSAKSVKALYQYLGFIPTITSIKLILINFVKSILFVFGYGIYLILFAVIYDVTKKIGIQNRIFDLFYACFLGIFPICISIFLLHRMLIESNAFVFNYIGIFSIVLFFLTFKQIKENKLFLILFVSVLICSYKSLFNICFNSYGAYYFPLLLVCCVIYFSEYFAENKISQRTHYKIILGLLIFSIGSAYLLSNMERKNLIFDKESYTFENRGKIFIEEQQKEAIIHIVNYIKENTKDSDTVLVLPEGAMINFLTNRKSHNKYYYLIPPNIEIFGEDNIKKDLEQNLPDYIVLQPMSYNNFNETYFCESFGNKICEIIPQYYDKPIVFGKDFWLAIYKKIK